MIYLLARARHGRATLQHVVDLRADNEITHTLCGRDVTEWSRAYQRDPIPEVLCMKCGQAELKEALYDV